MAAKRSALLLGVLLSLSGICSVWGSEEVNAEVISEAESLTSDVLVLDMKNFTDAVEKYDFMVVEFYAPWCGHCKQLAPQYEKAATELKSHDPPIILAKVDANEEENKPLAQEFDVTGFPTLMIFRKKGEVVSDFKGPRDSAGIVSYLKKLAGPPSIELTSAAQTEELLSENAKELVVIGVFETLDGEEYANFVQVADTQRSDYVFAHTLDVSFVPDNGVPLKTPSVRLHKDFDDKIAVSTEFSPEALTKFLEHESLHLVTELSGKPEHRPALMKFFATEKDKVFLFLAGPPADNEESAARLSSFRETAKAFQAKDLIFVFADEEGSANALQFFGLTAAEVPAYVIQSTKAKNYLAKQIGSEELAPWLDEYLAGNLKANIKSDPIPAFNDEPVKVIVADSLKEAVLDAGKDVFLEFYAPWCGHCKKLAPILEEIAVSFESDPDVVIAKFDATTNDVTSDLFDVKGFPTLYFYSASGVVTPYNGDRTKEAIIEFINENKSNPVKVEEALKETVEETTSVKDEL